MPETLVLLHGFGGTRHTWDCVVARLDPQRYRPLALDLPGHGELGSYKRPITFEACVEEVLAAAPERFALCGYSMGGRIALHLALSAPERVDRLVLVSSTAGLAGAAERNDRRAADSALAARLERRPFEEFIESWRTQPPFADEPPRVASLAREDHRRNEPNALAAALRGIGTGEMRSLWGRLNELTMPVRFVVGERDTKFLTLGMRMHRLVPNGEIDVLPGGHAVQLESPEALVRVLQRP